MAGFMDADCFLGDWENYQCKHYARPLGFTDIAPVSISSGEQGAKAIDHGSFVSATLW